MQTWFTRSLQRSVGSHPARPLHTATKNSYAAIRESRQNTSACTLQKLRWWPTSSLILAPPRHRHHSWLPLPRVAVRSIPENGNPDWMIDDRDYGPPNTELDAIMVLGGGLCPDGGIPPWVIRRLDAATHLYSLQPNNANGDKYGAKKCKVLLLGAGTPHKPAVVDSHGYVLHESTAYATYLMAQGVPACDILKETSSYDTVGNGYFSATMHAVPARWRQLAVITSHFHMSRAEAIFEATYALAGGDLLGDVDAFQLVYYPVSDAGLFDAEVLRARAEKEAKAVAAWRGTVAGMRTMADLHAWLFATHLCYSVSRQHEFGQSSDLDPRLAATY